MHSTGGLVGRRGRTASLSNIAYTLNARRSHFQERRAYVVNSRDELITRLREDQNNYSNLAPLPEDDGEELMRELLSIYGRAEAEEKKLLIQLANGYVAGTELDWSELYRNADVQVVSCLYIHLKENDIGSEKFCHLKFNLVKCKRIFFTP